MGFWRIFTVIGCIAATFGHCDDLWHIEQDFVKFGKKRPTNHLRKPKRLIFLKRWDLLGFASRDVDSSEYLYLIPVGDFSGLNTLMRKRMNFHKMLTKDEAEKQKILPFLTTVNFFIESVHRLSTGLFLCS